MSLQHLNLATITESDLIRLIDDGVGESKTLEYKEALTLVTDEQKREFLSDVTALANTEGGDLLLGMKAEKGVAVELVGLKNFIDDDVRGKIENLFRDFLQPRLTGVQLTTLALANGNHALLVRAPRSFTAPHMVRHQGVTRFCGRNSNGKYDLDVHELRSAFLANETLGERLKSFRLDRINRCLSGSTPIKLTSQRLTVLHVLPVSSARPDIRLATSDLRRVLESGKVRPLASSGHGPYFNFDGLLIASNWGNGAYHSTVQVFRNGFLEAIESEVLNHTMQLDGGNGEVRRIPSTEWENYLVESLPGFLQALADLGLSAPYVVSLTLLNVRGLTMAAPSNYFARSTKPFDRDNILVEEILVESANQPAATILRPLFDQVWNACGWAGSPNFDKNGNWDPKL